MKKIALIITCMLMLAYAGCESEKTEETKVSLDNCAKMKAEILCEIQGHTWSFCSIQQGGHLQGADYIVKFSCLRNLCDRIDWGFIHNPYRAYPWDTQFDPNEIAKSDYFVLRKLIGRYEP